VCLYISAREREREGERERKEEREREIFLNCNESDIAARAPLSQKCSVESLDKNRFFPN
jgi:hypothetical protein